MGFWGSRLRSPEEISNEVLPLFLLVLLIAIVPEWFVDPQGALFSAAIFGAVALLIWLLFCKLKQGRHGRQYL